MNGRAVTSTSKRNRDSPTTVGCVRLVLWAAQPRGTEHTAQSFLAAEVGDRVPLFRWSGLEGRGDNSSHDIHPREARAPRSSTRSVCEIGKQYA